MDEAKTVAGQALETEPSKAWRNWYVARARLVVTWAGGNRMPVAENQLFASNPFPTKEIAEQKALEDINFNASPHIEYLGTLPDGETP